MTPYRYEPPKIEQSLFYFTNDGTNDPVNVVKITCQGEHIYVRKVGDTWIVDKLLMPDSLWDALNKARKSGYRSAVNIRVDSAIVGSLISFSMDGFGWVDIWRSMHLVGSFQPTHRSTIRQEGGFQLSPQPVGIPSFTSSS